MERSGVNPVIVVIDDDVDTVECLRLALRRQAFHVVEAFAGVEGLALARQHKPGLVIAGLMMPGLSGLEVCRALRADPATAGIPVILLSARGALADQAAAFEAGASGYVVKPVSLTMLIKLVEDLLAQSAAAAAPRGAGVHE